MIIRRPMTEAQRQHLANKTKPTQEDINAASSELHQAEMQSFIRQDNLNLAYDQLLIDLMTRIADLEKSQNRLSLKTA